MTPRHRHFARDSFMLIRPGSVRCLLEPDRPERGSGHPERFKNVEPSVRFPGLASYPFKDVGCEHDASATILKPRPRLRGDRHTSELSGDFLSCRRYLLGP